MTPQSPLSEQNRAFYEPVARPPRILRCKPCNKERPFQFSWRDPERGWLYYVCPVCGKIVTVKP